MIRGMYTTEGAGEHAPCPFCGSTDTDLIPAGSFCYPKAYCHGCLTEFTFYPPVGKGHLTDKRLDAVMDRWDGRAGSDPDRCPFCGGDAVEFDGAMNYSTFFADAFCPGCGVRFEFQRVRRGKVEANNLRKARRAFGRRCAS